MARRSISLGLAALVFAVVTVASVDPAAACSCAGSTDSDAVAAADVVFSGELVEIRTPPGASYSSADPERFVFAVDHVYKGDAKARQSVVTPREGASCGLELSGSGPFLVFATTEGSFDLEGDEGELFSHLCSGTRVLAESAVPASFGIRHAPDGGQLGDREPRRRWPPRGPRRRGRERGRGAGARRRLPGRPPARVDQPYSVIPTGAPSMIWSRYSLKP